MSDPSKIVLPPRTPWRADFPDVVIHTTVALRDAHPAYGAAKAGDVDAARRLVLDMLDPEGIGRLQRIGRLRDVVLLPITALEAAGFNAIPDAMARVLAEVLGWRLSAGDIVQTNRVGHTRARAFNRIVTPATFAGSVDAQSAYILVDDHVGVGGTLANLKGHIEMAGGGVLAMTTLTESRDGRHIALRAETLDVLMSVHGDALEQFWQEEFGHGLASLTEIEGRLLCRERSLDAIRDRMAQAKVEVRSRGILHSVRIG